MKYAIAISSLLLAAACASNSRNDSKYKHLRNDQVYSVVVSGASAESAVVKNRLEQALTDHGLKVVPEPDKGAGGVIIRAEVATHDVQKIVVDKGEKYLAKVSLLMSATDNRGEVTKLNYRADAQEFGDAPNTASGHAIATATDQAAAQLLDKLREAF